MSQTTYERAERTKIPASFHMPGYEKALLPKLTKKAVEKLEETRREIARQSRQSEVRVTRR